MEYRTSVKMDNTDFLIFYSSEKIYFMGIGVRLGTIHQANLPVFTIHGQWFLG